MTRVQYYCAATLDGFIADDDDGIDWLTGYEGSLEGEGAEVSATGDGGAYERFYDGVGALVSGSTTYEFVREHTGPDERWPYAGKPYWVLSGRDLAVPDRPDVDVRIERGDVVALHERIAGSAGDRSLWIIGGGNVASQYSDAGLLDELIVTVVPVVLGSGKPLFEPGLRAANLELTGTTTFRSGMVELRYEVRRS